LNDANSIVKKDAYNKKRREKPKKSKLKKNYKRIASEGKKSVKKMPFLRNKKGKKCLLDSKKMKTEENISRWKSKPT
jgi:hypothetical protein